jgi:hypothetical protein
MVQSFFGKNAFGGVETEKLAEEVKGLWRCMLEH